MRRKIVLLVMMLVLCLSSVAYAGEVNVTLDDVSLAAKGIVVDNRTMLPLRDIAETMGLDVEWDNARDRINLYVDGSLRGEIDLIDGRSYRRYGVGVYINEKGRDWYPTCTEYYSDVTVQTINNTTYVPVAMMANIINGGAIWDQASNTAAIKTEKAWGKYEDQKALEADIASGKVIDLMDNLQGMDSPRDRRGGTMDKYGIRVEGLKAVKENEDESNIKGGCYLVDGILINESGRTYDNSLRYYVCVFNKISGRLTTSYRIDTTPQYWKPGGKTSIKAVFPLEGGYYDPIQHDIEVLLATPEDIKKSYTGDHWSFNI